MRDDGVVLFFGRKDQQVKVHGFRIELEEIEATLKGSPAVRQCAVLAVTSGREDAHLCAFLVPYGELDKESVVEYLKQSLPSYMIPTEFRFLKELPLLPNGKVDRASLGKLAQEQRAVRSYRAPASRLEGQLVQIWSEVMHMEQVSTDDDFFDLGGDSFKAIRIAAKYGPGLEVSDIYDGRTIEIIAKVVGQRSSQETCLSALVPRSAESRVVVVAIANSGGGPVSFFELAKAVAAVRSDVAFYAVKLPRRSADTAKALVAEVDRLADEICEELDELKLPVIVLAQCNGSALGIRLAQRLEARSAAAKALIVGGALLRMTETAPDCRSDREIMGLLESIGSTLPVEPDDRAFFLSDFRYDCALANAFYNSLLAPAERAQRISAALYCVVGAEDPLVRGYKTAVEDWRHLADKVMLREYPGFGHYLLRDCPERLARTICEIVEELNLAPVQPSTGAQPRRHRA